MKVLYPSISRLSEVRAVFMLNIQSLLDTLSQFIRDRDAVYKSIQEEKNLKEYFIASTIATLLFGAVYGIVMGFYAGGLQILYDAVKIPLLLLVSLYVSLPTYYVLNGILGGDLSLRQLTVLFMVSISLLTMMLMAFFPVTLFFTLTTPERTFTTYGFTVLINVLFFGISGVTAVSYLLQGFSRIHGENKRWVLAMIIGSCVLAFVGTQLAWVLRPYFHVSEAFIAPPSGNFYIALFELIIRLLRGW
ncbi:MAG: hypothetical protein JSW05_08705 [Candidatus Thorarchaeota archaeon]|nr:MAG: hypothetical protein JSW05_08705 [Candidatus Thorarchaeota archaeon]